jgi:MIP family channel proteins
MQPALIKRCVAEFIGTFALIFIGIGAIYHFGPVPGGLLGIAFAHGLTIAVMVAATAGISGGHLNPAVTFGLLVGGKINFKGAIAYWVAQLAGGTIAAFAAGSLCAYGDVKAVDVIISGTPAVGKNVLAGSGMMIEAILTFFLVFVVYGAAVDSRAGYLGPISIGLTVTLDILFGGPFTGAAMNVARWFGPALASGTVNGAGALVYIVGPLLGGGLAGLIYGRFLIRQP